MSEILLKTLSFEDCTIGRLFTGDFQCMTLELPWKGSKKNISCIPAGRYKYKKRLSPKNGHVIELVDVPNRTFIQFHAGNFTRQIEGCVLVGDGLKDIDKDTITDVTNSKLTLSKFLESIDSTGNVMIQRSI